MGDWNQVTDGLIEIPVKGPKCEPCDGNGKALVKNDKDETVEVPCVNCDGRGWMQSGAVKWRRYLRNKAKSDFENWLEDTARRKVFDSHTRGAIDASELKMSLNSVNTLVSSYSFRWDGEAWRSAMSKIPGVAKMYHLLTLDANRLLVKQGQPPQAWTEIDFVRWLFDPAMQVMLSAAWQQVVDNSPNFLLPPVPGVEED